MFVLEGISALRVGLSKGGFLGIALLTIASIDFALQTEAFRGRDEVSGFRLCNSCVILPRNV